MTLSEQLDKFANETRDTVDIICRIAKRQGREEVLNLVDDIKAEIVKWIEMDGGSEDYDKGLKRALCIIDKHISGKENE